MRPDAELEVATLRALVERGHRSVDAGAPFFVVWGVLAALAALGTQYVLQTGAGIAPGLVWGVALGAAWVVTALLASRRGRVASVLTVGDRLLGQVWIGCAVALTLVAAASAGPLLPGRAVAGLTALILGAGCFASAPVAGRWLLVLAGLWWAAGVLLLLATWIPTLPVFAVFLVLFQVLPGLAVMTRAGSRQM